MKSGIYWAKSLKGTTYESEGSIILIELTIYPYGSGISVFGEGEGYELEDFEIIEKCEKPKKAGESL